MGPKRAAGLSKPKETKKKKPVEDPQDAQDPIETALEPKTGGRKRIEPQPSTSQPSPVDTMYNEPEDAVSMTDKKETIDDPNRDRFQEIGKESPESTKKWTAHKEKLLCTLWEEEIQLYDPSHKYHRLTDKRHQAFERIAAILKMHVQDVKTHSSSLRTAYKKLRNVPSGSGADRLTNRQRDILKMCGFLYNYTGTRDTQSNLPTAEEKKETKKRFILTAAAAEELRKKGIVIEDLEVHEDEEKKSKSKNLKGKSAVPADGDVPDPVDKTPEVINNPGYFAGSNRRKTLVAKKQEEISKELHGRNEMLQSLTASVSSIAESASSLPPGERKCDDNICKWSEILADRIREMDPKVGSRFMVHVDTLALDSLDGVWPAPK